MATALYDLKAAYKAGKKSTGNGFRGGSSVSEGPTNLIVEPGDKSFDELCQEAGEGIILTDLSGLHAGLNAISGDFSLLCEGYLIENGKQGRPVEQITVAGNFYEVLKAIEAVGNDIINLPSGEGEFFTPSVLIPAAGKWILFALVLFSIVRMTAVCRRENELIAQLDGAGMRIRRESREISDLVCCMQTGFDLSEAIELNDGKPPISSIIRSHATLCVGEIQILPGKLTVRGDAIFTMIYCTEQNDSPERLEYVIPFSQFFDIPGIDEECKTDISLCCDMLEVSPRTDSDGEYRRVDVDIRVSADIKVYREKEVSWVSDAYSVDYEVSCVRKQVRLERLCDTVFDTEICRQSVDTGDVRIESVGDLWANILDSRSNYRDGRTVVNGNMAVCMILRDPSKGIVYVEKNVRFECAVPQTACGQNLRSECGVGIKSCAFTVTGDTKLEIQAELCLHSSLYEDIPARQICSVELDDSRPKSSENRPAAVLYFAEPGEELWDIAREYNSSVESIRLDNGIEGDAVEESRLLIVTA